LNVTPLVFKFDEIKPSDWEIFLFKLLNRIFKTIYFSKAKVFKGVTILVFEMDSFY